MHELYGVVLQVPPLAPFKKVAQTLEFGGGQHAIVISVP